MNWLKGLLGRIRTWFSGGGAPAPPVNPDHPQTPGLGPTGEEPKL